VVDETGIDTGHISGIKDTLACGMAMGSSSWNKEGIMYFKLVMCHIYDWDSQKELIISNGNWDAEEMCPYG
jgi:hypothetical protein